MRPLGHGNTHTLDPLGAVAHRSLEAREGVLGVRSRSLNEMNVSGGAGSSGGEDVLHGGPNIQEEL
jgi:hypothetical protein